MRNRESPTPNREIQFVSTQLLLVDVAFVVLEEVADRVYREIAQ